MKKIKNEPITEKPTAFDLRSSHYKTLLKEFANYLRTVGYSPSTRQQLPTCTKEFLQQQEQKGNLYITNIRSADIQQHYEYLHTRPNKTRGGGLSGSMIAGHLFALRIFFKWLEQAEIQPHNPISGLNFPYPEYAYRTSLTQEEITKLYEATETLRDRALLGLFYGCGLRRAEGENINSEDIRLKEKILIVREGKGNKRRVVPLAEQVKEDFENYYYQERNHYLLEEHNAFMINNKARRMTRNSYNPRLKY